MRTLIYNIGTLIGVLPEEVLRLQDREMDSVRSIDNAYLVIEDDRIAEFGQQSAELLQNAGHFDNIINAGHGMVLPSFCDSHTHLVYAGCRDGEFRGKIAGLSYEEIAARGGGILNSADLLHNTSEEELYRQSMVRIREIISMGTGAVEIKSGYGLTTEDELKMLRVIRRIKETSHLVVRSTFLGAHAVGRRYTGRQEEYVDLICREMLPNVAAENLADYVDVFCDKGFFTVPQTERIL